MEPMIDRARRGEYYTGDAELSAKLDRAQTEVMRLNTIGGEDSERRHAELSAFLGGFGEGSIIRPPFYCDFGDGITIGDRTFINSTCTMLDVASITIGSECDIACAVSIVTATHPIDPVARRADWELAKPIVIGDGVWIGAGVVVCPGVTIGENSVIGAGAVVTRDIPAGVVAYGNPARAMREIGEQDRLELPGL